MRKAILAMMFVLTSSLCLASDFNLGGLLHQAQEAAQAYEVMHAANSLMHGDGSSAVGALESLAGMHQQQSGVLGTLESLAGGQQQQQSGLLGAIESMTGMGQQNQGYGYGGQYHPNEYGHGLPNNTGSFLNDLQSLAGYQPQQQQYGYPQQQQQYFPQQQQGYGYQGQYAPQNYGQQQYYPQQQQGGSLAESALQGLQGLFTH